VSNRFAVVYEAQADFTTATDLADRHRLRTTNATGMDDRAGKLENRTRVDSDRERGKSGESQ
jgi:hypothetical protein